MSLRNMQQFNEIIEKINKIIIKYEEKKIFYKQFQIYLADGSNFKYCIPKNSIVHLLGIDTNYLCSTGYFNSKNSYNILKQLCKESYRYSGMVKDGRLELEKMFSKHINEKIDNFFENIFPDIDNCEFVCKYDREKVIQRGYEPRNCEYIIFKQNEDGVFQELDLVKREYGYVPISNRAYSNIEDPVTKNEINHILNSQNISFISTVISRNRDYGYFDNGHKVFLDEKEKRNHLTTLMSYQKNFDCNIDILNDYSYTLKKISKNKQKRIDNYDTIGNIINCIIKQKVITENDLNVDSFDELPKDIFNLINALNNNITSNISNENGQIAYSKLQEKVKLLKEANETIEKENIELNQELIYTKQKLNDTEKSYQKTMNIIDTVKATINQI